MSKQKGKKADKSIGKKQRKAAAKATRLLENPILQGQEAVSAPSIDQARLIKPASSSQTQRQPSPKQPQQELLPFDKTLLERTRTQWQFGDWSNLAAIEPTNLQHHPERAKLALLAAAGHLQLGQNTEGRQFVRQAHDWGIDKGVCAQILVNGVYNSLARAFSIAGRQEKASQHFEQAVYLGNPGSTLELLAQARSQQQLQQLNKRKQNLLAAQIQTQTSKHIQNTNAHLESANQQGEPAKYLCSIKLKLDNNQVVNLGLNTESKDCVVVQDGTLKYQNVDNRVIYLVSSEHGKFERPSTKPQFQLAAGKRYVLSGDLVHEGDNKPVIWFFQYADGRRIHSQNKIVMDGKFLLEIQQHDQADSFAIGVRLGGGGLLQTGISSIKLIEAKNTDLLELFEKKLEQVKEAHRKEVENSTKQIESSIRLQHYLGESVILPDMHNWPISPDFGVLLINLVERNNYNAVIEFGSGTSTVILSKALNRVASRDNNLQAPLLSFDHLQEYAEKTIELLKQSGLQKNATVSLAPLTEWEGNDHGKYSYYSCQKALLELTKSLPNEPLKVLVVVDGPPAATGPLARYPAMPVVMSALPGASKIDFLMDDYLRKEEQEIVSRWIQLLTQQQRKVSKTEFNKLEKKACLIEVEGA